MTGALRNWSMTPHYRLKECCLLYYADNGQAAEAMDRAAAAPLEQKVPPRYVRAFCGNETHALDRWKATRRWRKENEIDSILNEPQPFFHDIRRYFPSHM